MTRHFSKVEIAMFRIDTHPVEAEVNGNLNDGGGSQRNPKAECWLSAAEFLLQSLPGGLWLLHRIVS
jgi:hypothetical protein